MLPLLFYRVSLVVNAGLAIEWCGWAPGEYRAGCQLFLLSQAARSLASGRAGRMRLERCCYE